MDWQLAITRNREALAAIIVALIKSLGLEGGGMLTTLPVLVYLRALAILRPAESAVRRLIMIAALQLVKAKFRARALRECETNFALLPRGPMTKIPVFTLIDPLKAPREEAPGFEVLEAGFDASPVPAGNTRVSALNLSRRLLALKKALDNLPREAKRLARWYAQRDAARRILRPHRLSPMRPGPPQGLPRRGRSEVQEVLYECHLLAIYARDQHDSS
jgi:hypothetical protein